MRRVTAIVLSFMLGISSCAQKKENNIPSSEVNNSKIQKKDTMSIPNALVRQIKSGGYVSNEVTDIAYYKFQEDDLYTTLPIIENILRKNGYQKISFNVYEQKVNEIFGKRKLYRNIYYINGFELCFQPEKINYYDPDGFRADTYIDMEAQIITKLFYIPELVDYQKEFPEIASIEDTIQTEKRTGDSEENIIYINRWKDIPDLDQQQKFNEQLLINRNLYLFNDDKSRLPWLLKNDSGFMKNLVLTFGWTEDEKLLKWVIENNKFDKNNPLEFGKMFYTKRCDETLKLHSNTFKYLQKTVTPENQGILRDIKLFVQYFADSQNQIEGITEIERLEIVSNIVYFAEQYKYEEGFKNRRIMAWMYFFVGQRKSEELLKQNNYFNLPKFKQWWDEMYSGKDFNDVTDINDGMLDDYDP